MKNDCSLWTGAARLGLPILAVLLLASCIEVEDFGPQWSKGFVDPALAGSWKKSGVPGEGLNDTPGADRLSFAGNGPSYAFQEINPIDSALAADVAAQRRKDNEVRSAVRTLRIGRSLFLMQKPTEDAPKGMLQRYDIRGTVMRLYTLDGDRAVQLLETRHPAATNITENKGEGTYVEIHTFDDEVVRILSEFADDPAFWDLECQYRKVR